MSRKCIICDRRPRLNGSRYCQQCGSAIAAEEQRRKPQQPVKYLVYRGAVLGFFPNGGDELKARLLRRSADRLPKSRTIFLDTYCPGFTREQIKRFKRTVRVLAGV